MRTCILYVNRWNYIKVKTFDLLSQCQPRKLIMCATFLPLINPSDFEAVDGTHRYGPNNKWCSCCIDSVIPVILKTREDKTLCSLNAAVKFLTSLKYSWSGNLLVERMAGAQIHMVTKEEYTSVGSTALGLQLAEELRAQVRGQHVSHALVLCGMSNQ